MTISISTFFFFTRVKEGGVLGICGRALAHSLSACRTISIGRPSPNRPYQYKKKGGTQCKNVDYAAYEYNVYVQCNYNGGNKVDTGHLTAKKKNGGGRGQDSITYDNQWVEVKKETACPVYALGSSQEIHLVLVGSLSTMQTLQVHVPAAFVGTFTPAAAQLNPPDGATGLGGSGIAATGAELFVGRSGFGSSQETHLT